MPPRPEGACLSPSAATWIAAAWLCAPPLHGGLLYFTDFDAFPTGPDMWAGTEEWTANSPGVGAHGIDEGLVIGLGKTAYLGFNQPDTTLVTVARPLDHDPVAEDTDRVVIDCLLGIEDSENGRRDSFFLSIYNRNGVYVAALRFSNELATFGIWREDGLASHDTGISFIHGELHLVYLEIDFQNNWWRGELDGIPLFYPAPFTATGAARDLGWFAVEWQLAGASPAEFGDNWMLFADCAVWAVPPGQSPFTIDAITIDPDGRPVLTWTGEPGWTYQVEYSDNLHDWQSDLPGSTIPGPDPPQPIGFTDTAPNPPASRNYRVIRSMTP